MIWHIKHSHHHAFQMVSIWELIHLLSDNTPIWHLTASLAFLLMLYFYYNTINPQVSCHPLSPSLIYSLYSVQWSIPQSIFIPALLIRSTQNTYRKSEKAVFWRAQQQGVVAWWCRVCVTQGPWCVAECPCQLLLPFLAINAAANISHQWGNQIKTGVNQ